MLSLLLLKYIKIHFLLEMESDGNLREKLVTHIDLDSSNSMPSC